MFLFRVLDGGLLEVVDFILLFISEVDSLLLILEVMSLLEDGTFSSSVGRFLMIMLTEGGKMFGLGGGIVLFALSS